MHVAATAGITITFNQPKAMRYLKIHFWFDDRGGDAGLHDHTSFLNDLANMLQVYQEADSLTEEYQYDAAGNRKLTRMTLVQAEENESLYYSNSDRLKTNGKYGFKYDAAGNLTEKGNMFSINGDTVTFTTSGDGVEYWQYRYDLLNRLVEVKKNGTLISEYGYDPEGLRVVKKANNQTIHYVFEGTEPIYEKNVTTGAKRSYVFALGKHLARVDGVIGDTEAKKYWYSCDHLGSVKAVTDDAGAVVFQADHLAFGQRVGESTTEPGFEEWHSFTGKEFDPDTGLYYFNARWYDAETGRFISEDPVADPNNPNLYSYCANNPLNRIDPSGLCAHCHDPDFVGPPCPDPSTGGSGDSGGNSSSSSDSKKKNIWEGFKNLWNSFWNWSDSKNLDFSNLIDKSNNGKYWEEYEKNTGPFFYGVNAGEEYAWLIKNGKLDPDKVSFEQFVNNMGALWEYNSRTRTMGDCANCLIQTALIYYFTIEAMAIGAEAVATLGLISGRAANLIDEMRIAKLNRSISELSVTKRGLARIERHLTKTPGLEPGAAEFKMLERLKSGCATPQDLRFYQHELLESHILKTMNGAFEDPVDVVRAAHHATLQMQGLFYRGYEKAMYTPDAMDLF